MLSRYVDSPMCDAELRRQTSHLVDVAGFEIAVKAEHTDLLFRFCSTPRRAKMTKQPAGKGHPIWDHTQPLMPHLEGRAMIGFRYSPMDTARAPSVSCKLTVMTPVISCIARSPITLSLPTLPCRISDPDTCVARFLPFRNAAWCLLDTKPGIRSRRALRAYAMPPMSSGSCIALWLSIVPTTSISIRRDRAVFCAGVVDSSQEP